MEVAWRRWRRASVGWRRCSLMQGGIGLSLASALLLSGPAPGWHGLGRGGSAERRWTGCHLGQRVLPRAPCPPGPQAFPTSCWSRSLLVLEDAAEGEGLCRAPLPTPLLPSAAQRGCPGGALLGPGSIGEQQGKGYRAWLPIPADVRLPPRARPPASWSPVPGESQQTPARQGQEEGCEEGSSRPPSRENSLLLCLGLVPCLHGQGLVLGTRQAVALRPGRCK